MECNKTASEEQPLYLNKLLMTCLVMLEQIKLFSCTICDKLYCHKESLTTHLTTHARELSPPMRKPDYNKCRTYYSKHARNKQHSQNAISRNNKDTKCSKIPYGEKVINPGQRSSMSFRDRITFEDDNENLDNDEMNSITSVNDIECCTEKSKVITALKQVRKLYACHICNEQFAHGTSLTIHIAKHLGKTLFTCDVCGLEFNCKAALRDHKISHSNVHPYICDICKTRYKRKRYLRNHILRTHSVIRKSLKCEICDKSFKFLNYLKLHHRRHHTEEGTLSCETCNISFRNYSSMKYHAATVHMPKEKWMKCDLCNKSFGDKQILMRHILRHTKTGYRCRICKMECGHPLTLARHLKKHSVNDNLKCSFCDRWFLYNYFRERHERTQHMKCFDFECHLCKKKFGRKDHLKRHIIRNCPFKDKQS